MTELPKEAIGGVAGKVHDELNQFADDLEAKAPVTGHSHRMTLMIVAGTCFVLGFLWAKARAQSF
jgi:hypothetical protein